MQNHFLQGAIGELVRIQTTFIEIVLEKTTYRVDFRSKREFSAKTGAFSSLDIFNQHPLLLDYIEPKAQLYFADAPSDPEALLGELRVAVDTLFEGWRDAKRYLNPLLRTPALLRQKGGMLLQGPLSLVLQAQQTTDAHDMHPSVTVTKGHLVDPQNLQVLLLDNHYFVAEQFQFASP